MALTRKRAETIPAKLNIEGQGEKIKFDIVYYNRKQSEVDASLAEHEKEPDTAQTVLFVVKEWDAEYPLTLEGLREMEDDRPGMMLAIVVGFQNARRFSQSKN